MSGTVLSLILGLKPSEVLPALLFRFLLKELRAKKPLKHNA